MANIQRGRTNYLAGLGAEDAVARDYEGRGLKIIRQRFRGKRGEIDLVAQDGFTTVFVEVKSAKTHSHAALRVTPDKVQRLCQTAEEYAARLPSGSLTEMRFDVALVDDMGRVKIHENALMT